MQSPGDKILTLLIDNLSVIEIENLLAKKKGLPEKVTEETELEIYYTNLLEKKVFAPIK